MAIAAWHSCVSAHAWTCECRLECWGTNAWMTLAPGWCHGSDKLARGASPRVFESDRSSRVLPQGPQAPRHVMRQRLPPRPPLHREARGYRMFATPRGPRHGSPPPSPAARRQRRPGDLRTCVRRHAAACMRTSKLRTCAACTRSRQPQPRQTVGSGAYAPLLRPPHTRQERAERFTVRERQPAARPGRPGCCLWPPACRRGRPPSPALLLAPTTSCCTCLSRPVSMLLEASVDKSLPRGQHRHGGWPSGDAMEACVARCGPQHSSGRSGSTPHAQGGQAGAHGAEATATGTHGTRACACVGRPGARQPQSHQV